MIGLVTVLYKCDDMLEGFFKSLALQYFQDYHLYLIDNSVNDYTTNLISELVQKYQISYVSHVLNSENVGVATGNNQGIKASLEAGFTHTLLLNNDIEFSQPTLLGEMVQKAIDNKEAMVIPKICFYDTGLIWMAGGKFRFLTGYTKHIGEGKLDGVKFNRRRYFNYAPTCFMLISNSLFEEVGMMDDRYFVYFDDTDFVYRAYKKGYKILYLPEYTIRHKVSSSTGGKMSNFTIYYGNRNRLFFIRKNYPYYLKTLSILSFLVTLSVKLLLYSRDQRKALLSGFNSGFALKLK